MDKNFDELLMNFDEFSKGKNKKLKLINLLI
jgi:hypothetical protein